MWRPTKLPNVTYIGILVMLEAQKTPKRYVYKLFGYFGGPKASIWASWGFLGSIWASWDLLGSTWASWGLVVSILASWGFLASILAWRAAF